MKIALVQDFLTSQGGGEQVVFALHEMYPDAPIYTSVHNPEKTPLFAKATVIPSYLQKISWLKTHHQIAIPLMPAAFESFDLKGFDVIVSIGGGLSKGVITHPGQRHIAYCHTPLRYAWRLGGDDRTKGWLREKVTHHLRLWDVVSAERVDQFLGNSQTVCDRIRKIYRQPAEPVYPPVNTNRYTILDLPISDYVISVGRLVSYKRNDLIIDACLASNTPLVIVGTGPDEVALRARAANSPLIRFAGRVSDDELKKLYAQARAFVFAAEEDFGIVPVEAMCAGRPVIAYGRGGVTETVEEGLSGVFFPEQTSESLAQALKTFDHTAYNPEKIRERALRFSVDAFKEKMRSIIEFQS